MIHECVDQYACLAANINFNLEGLRKGFWQLAIDGSPGRDLCAGGCPATRWCRRAAADQLRHSEIFMLACSAPYFALDVIMGFTPSGMPTTRIALTVLYLGIAMLFAIAGVGFGGGGAGICLPTARCEDATLARSRS